MMTTTTPSEWSDKVEVWQAHDMWKASLIALGQFFQSFGDTEEEARARVLRQLAFHLDPTAGFVSRSDDHEEA